MAGGATTTVITCGTGRSCMLETTMIFPWGEMGRSPQKLILVQQSRGNRADEGRSMSPERPWGSLTMYLRTVAAECLIPN